MRRKDREVSGTDNLREIIEKCTVCRLSMVDKGMPYIVPLNFGYTMGGGMLTLYFHSAKAGRKIDILRENDNVCFEISYTGNLIESDDPCSYGYEFESVIGFGRAEFIEDPKEKGEALSLLMHHLSKKDFSFTEAQADSVCVFKVVSNEFTGKKKSG